jgi:hypothetical protein
VLTSWTPGVDAGGGGEESGDGIVEFGGCQIIFGAPGALTGGDQDAAIGEEGRGAVSGWCDHGAGGGKGTGGGIVDLSAAAVTA